MWKIGQCCCRPESTKIVKVNGWIILEVGFGNHPNKVLSIFKDSNYRNAKLIKDFNGDNRILIAQV